MIIVKAEVGGWSSYNTYPRKLADINGDGMADIIGFKDDGVYTALANGDGTFQDAQFAYDNFTTIRGSWTDYNTYLREVADINGDGMADIIGFGGRVRISLSKGDGTFDTHYSLELEKIFIEIQAGQAIIPIQES